MGRVYPGVRVSTSSGTLLLYLCPSICTHEPPVCQLVRGKSKHRLNEHYKNLTLASVRAHEPCKSALFAQKQPCCDAKAVRAEKLIIPPLSALHTKDGREPMPRRASKFRYPTTPKPCLSKIAAWISSNEHKQTLCGQEPHTTSGRVSLFEQCGAVDFTKSYRDDVPHARDDFQIESAL